MSLQKTDPLLKAKRGRRVLDPRDFTAGFASALYSQLMTEIETIEIHVVAPASKRKHEVLAAEDIYGEKPTVLGHLSELATIVKAAAR